MADIMKTYHDVTTLDKGIALTKIKDIMDISPRTEFYSVLKDPLSHIARVGDRDLVFESSYNFADYMKPGRHYTFTCSESTFSLSSTNVTFAASVDITKLVYTAVHIIGTNNEQEWAGSVDGIREHAHSVALIYNPNEESADKWIFYFAPNYHQNASSIPSTITAGTVVSGAHYYIYAKDLKVLEFKAYTIGGSFTPSETTDIFTKYFKRSYVTEDYANAFYVTRNTTGRYSILIKSLSFDYLNVFMRFLDNVLKYNYEYANNEMAFNLIKDCIPETSATANNLTYSVPAAANGIIEIKDTNSAAYLQKKLEEYGEGSNKDIIIFNDVNYSAAEFIKSVLMQIAVSANANGIEIHEHSSQNLFDNVTFSSITHPKGTNLVIGNPNDPYVSGIDKRVLFVENIDLNDHQIFNVANIQGADLDVTRGTITTLTASTGTFTTSITTPVMTVSNVLTAQNLGIDALSVPSSITGMPLLVFQITDTNNDGTVKGTIRRTSATFDATITNIATDGFAYRNSHLFLSQAGTFIALTPNYLGAASDSHTHGYITNDGKITDTATIADTTVNGNNIGDGIIISDVSDGGKLAIGQRFNTNATNPKRQYLALDGTWAYSKDLLFRGALTTSAAIDGATDFGLYSFTGYTFPGPTIGSSQMSGIPGTDRNGYTPMNASGILLVLTSTADKIVAGNTYTGDITQIAYTIEGDVTIGGNSVFRRTQVFVRSGTHNATTGVTWTSWLALAHTDHDHDKEYAKIDDDGTRIATSLTIYGNAVGNNNVASDPTKLYIDNANGGWKGNNNGSLIFRDDNTGSGDDILEYKITTSNSNAYHTWTVGGNTIMTAGAYNGSNKVDISGRLTVTDDTRLAAPLKLSTTNSGTNGAVIYTDNNTAANANTPYVMVLGAADQSTGYRTVSYCTDVSVSELKNKIPLQGSSAITGSLAPANDKGANLGGSGQRWYYNYFYRIFGLQSIENTTDGSNRLALPSKSGTIAVTSDLPTAAVASVSGSGGSDGLLTAVDKERLDEVWGAWTADSNNLSDKLSEIKNLFRDYNSSSTVLGLFSTKVNKAGDTMTGTLTANTGDRTGIKLGDTYLTAISGEVILQNNSAIRFGSSDWDYDCWAGLKYNHSAKTITLGLADSTNFTANHAQSGGTVRLAGISSLDLNNTGSITNLAVGGGIYWNPYVESSSDPSDAASIRVIGGGVLGGTELRIQQSNDSNDCINLVAPYYVCLNGKGAFAIYDNWLRINESGDFSSGTYFGQTTVRTDGRFEINTSGQAFYADINGDTYTNRSMSVKNCKMQYNTSEDCLDFIFS